MRFSSISLIAAALAAIAGSTAITDPGPLHARDLEEVNSFKFERDLDVHSSESGVAVLKREGDSKLVDLLTRRTLTPTQCYHSKIADTINSASQDSRRAAYHTHVAWKRAKTFLDRRFYRTSSTHFQKMANWLETVRDAHRNAARSSSVDPQLRDNAAGHAKNADECAKEARVASTDAIRYYLAREIIEEGQSHHDRRMLS